MTKPIALVVEDDDALSDLFCRALQSTGYETLSAKDGLDAEEKLSSTVPDLLLLDLHLPKKDGTEILKSVQADDRLKNQNCGGQFRLRIGLSIQKLRESGFEQTRELFPVEGVINPIQGRIGV